MHRILFSQGEEAIGLNPAQSAGWLARTRAAMIIATIVRHLHAVWLVKVTSLIILYNRYTSQPAVRSGVGRT